ncbi:MAG TPA: aspartate/glutamate racemase family protein [candidate division Zixibacteria bacterium]|nr:aspartate/glutamate racemase family protein [candidate division Zixibacteria bacterium]
MKIMVVMGQYPPEEAERRRQAVLRCASPGTEIGFSVVDATFFRRSNSEANALATAPLVAEAARKAEADGYDAVVPFGTLDVGVELSRNLVAIPVVGAGQSVLHLGAQLSDRLGVISYEEKSIPFMRKHMKTWGVDQYVVAIRAINVPLAESTKLRDEIRKRFVAAGRDLVERDGAEIIVAMGVTMVPVHYSAAEMAAEIGVPVLDALAASIHTAEMMVRMGVAHSVKTYPRVQA